MVLPLNSTGETVRFTPWGIVSGLFWVPGGVAGIYGIRNAGLAVAVGTWSSIIVLTSFSWGVFVFEERVKSIQGACGACATLMTGLLGMSLFSRPPTIKRDKKIGGKEKTEGDLEANDVEGISKRIPQIRDEVSDRRKNRGIKKVPKPKDSEKAKDFVSKNVIARSPSSLTLKPLEIEPLLNAKSKPGEDSQAPEQLDKKNTISLFDDRITLTKRQVGILAAAFNGGWGGANLVPLHYASQEGFGGPSYVISFACGSMIVTIGLWVLRYMYELYRLDGAVVKAFHALPSFYIRQMWLQGLLSGLLYSLGNFMSIIAVTHLGQGVGYSFTQTSMLVSGLW